MMMRVDGKCVDGAVSQSLTIFLSSLPTQDVIDFLVLGSLERGRAPLATFLAQRWGATEAKTYLYLRKQLGDDLKNLSLLIGTRSRTQVHSMEGGSYSSLFHDECIAAYLQLPQL